LALADVVALAAAFMTMQSARAADMPTSRSPLPTMSMLRSPLQFLPRPRLHGCLDLISSDAQGTWGVPTHPGICRRPAA
jgi:hypothetical protein